MAQSTTMFKHDYSEDFLKLKLDPKHVRQTGNTIGTGADAVVTEVKWVGTICVAKAIHSVLIEDESAYELFMGKLEQECLTWSTLKHPQIVLLLGVHILPGHKSALLILEKMDTSLRKYMENVAERKANFLLRDKIFILRQVAQALVYLHSRDPVIVHHDLTPNNILLDEQSFSAKLTDFGLSRALDPATRNRESKTNGTVVFMPPEVLSEPVKYDDKLDSFSFGNVIIAIVIHDFPTVGAAKVKHNFPKAAKVDMIAVSEYDRRQESLCRFGSKEQTLFHPVVRKCLRDDPRDRPCSTTLLSDMVAIQERHPRPKPADMVEIIKKKDEECLHTLQQLHDQEKVCRDLQCQLLDKDKLFAAATPSKPDIPDSKYFTVAVIGKASSGKSTFCNFLCKSSTFKTGNCLDPFYQNFQNGMVELKELHCDTKLLLLDFPSYKEGSENDEDAMLHEMKRALSEYKSGIDAVFLTINCSKKLTIVDLELLKLIDNLGIWQHCVLLVTYGSKLGKDATEQKQGFSECIQSPEVDTTLQEMYQKCSDRFVVVESVSPEVDAYYDSKACELVGVIQDVQQSTVGPIVRLPAY